MLPIFIRQGWPQAMNHLSGITGRAPCYPAFSQALRLRKCRRDGVNCGPVAALSNRLEGAAIISNSSSPTFVGDARLQWQTNRSGLPVRQP